MATHHAFPNLQVSAHPLVRHKIRLLADRHTEPKLFRELTRELTALLVYEATRDLPTRDNSITLSYAFYPVEKRAANH